MAARLEIRMGEVIKETEDAGEIAIKLEDCVRRLGVSESAQGALGMIGSLRY